MSDLSTMSPRAREAHDALSAVVEQFADVFHPSCEAHDEDGCTLCPARTLTAWVLVHEWSDLETGASSMRWNSAPGTGYYHAVGLMTEAAR